jgi:signal transduction histidine kinase
VTPGQWLRARRRVLLIDGLVAVAVVAVELLLVLTLPAYRPAGRAAAIALSVLCALPIVLSRTAPRAAVALCVLTVAAAATTLGWFPASHQVSYIVVAYTTASRFAVRPAAVAAALLWAPVLLIDLVVGDARGDGTVPAALLIVFNVLTALVVFFIGRTVHGRRVSARVLRERAAAAEANQRALAAHAVTDERRRIARELHDVVAHHISVIGVLATGARRVLHRDPAAADEALETIAGTSRTTLREMRRLLDVLRSDTEPDAQLAPQPGLAGIQTLVEQVREAGLPVRLEVHGTPVPMETGVALTVYRIVQEALTNTLKHAGAATALVRLCFGDGGLRLHVSDTGQGPPAQATGAGVGHGLVGMRERVALYGGTLSTGAGVGGGFTVDATIPGDQLGTHP